MALPQPNDQTRDLSDAQLASDVARADTQAVAAVDRRHAHEMLAVALRVVQSQADAEDVVHDVFVGLPEALRRYDERGTFSSSLRTVTARVALARLRQRAVTDSVEDGPEPSAPARDLDSEISLANAMRQLSPSLRAV